MKNSLELLTKCEAESRRLAAAGKKAVAIFEMLAEETLAETFAELAHLARAAGDTTRAATIESMGAMLPTVLDGLRQMSGAVDQLTAVAEPLVDGFNQLKATFRVN